MLIPGRLSVALKWSWGELNEQTCAFFLYCSSSYNCMQSGVFASFRILTLICMSSCKFLLGLNLVLILMAKSLNVLNPFGFS